jgi:6-phosphogluconolactonase (cycloisomerase 2 family)
MRMTLNKTGQLVLAAAASLLAASLVTACGTLTVDFVYVASAKAAGTNSYGEINVFEVNSESGRMRQIPTSPFPSGGRNPVAEAISSDQQNLYVVNRDDNTIVQFVIGNDGKVYPTSTVNTPGIFPIAVAVSGKHLFIADTYQPLSTCSDASPCSGSIGVFTIAATTSGSTEAGGLTGPVLNGSKKYWPLTISSGDVITPTAIAAKGSYVYVTAYDAKTSNAGYVFGFSVGSDGSLTALNNGVPLTAGVKPSGIAIDPSGAYVYVTDKTSGTVLAYSISSDSKTAGQLSAVSGSPFQAGDGPSAVAVDSTGKWLFVTNSVDSNLQVYAISNGVLTSKGTYATGLDPVAVGIDPSANQYIYTVNYQGNNVSGFSLNASTGALVNSQYSPFSANNEPTSVAAITHGGTKK